MNVLTSGVNVVNAAMGGVVPVPFQRNLSDCTAQPGGSGQCFYVACCTPCAYAEVTSEVLGKGEPDCALHALVFAMCPFVLPCVQAQTRIKVYEKYNILDPPGVIGKQSFTEAVAACACWSFIPCIPLFMMCQELNEIKLRRMQPTGMAGVLAAVGK